MDTHALKLDMTNSKIREHYIGFNVSRLFHIKVFEYFGDCVEEFDCLLVSTFTI